MPVSRYGTKRMRKTDAIYFELFIVFYIILLFILYDILLYFIFLTAAVDFQGIQLKLPRDWFPHSQLFNLYAVEYKIRFDCVSRGPIPQIAIALKNWYFLSSLVCCCFHYLGNIWVVMSYQADSSVDALESSIQTENVRKGNGTAMQYVLVIAGIFASSLLVYSNRNYISSLVSTSLSSNIEDENSVLSSYATTYSSLSKSFKMQLFEEFKEKYGRTVQNHISYSHRFAQHNIGLIFSIFPCSMQQKKKKVNDIAILKTF